MTVVAISACTGRLGACVYTNQQRKHLSENGGPK
jgi:hypothetical protein